MFVSIISKSNPLAEEEWGLSNLMTSASLAAIGKTKAARAVAKGILSLPSEQPLILF